MPTLSAPQEATVETAIAAYEAHLRDVKKNRDKSVRETVRRLRLFFCAAEHGARPLTWWTATRAAARYEAFAAGVSVDYHRNTLAESKTWLTWCATRPRSWLRSNPLAEVKGQGKRRKGKRQLRPEEGLAWRNKGVELGRAGDEGAVAALLLLDSGARPGEVVTRQVRDLVDRARLVLVDEVDLVDGEWRPKTDGSKRPLGPLPQDLRELLLEQARGKLPAAYLFPAGTRRRGAQRRPPGGPHDVGWVDDQVKRICRAAGVPEVCAHSMRGLRTTLDLLAGRSLRDVQQDRGHEDARTTLGYAAPGAAAAAQQGRYLEAINGLKED